MKNMKDNEEGKKNDLSRANYQKSVFISSTNQLERKLVLSSDIATAHVDTQRKRNRIRHTVHFNKYLN